MMLRISSPSRLWIWLPIGALVFFIGIAPFLATHDPLHTQSGQELAPPSANHWLGTDHLGRDEWSRLVAGGRRTLGGASVAVGIAVGVGLIMGSFMSTLSPLLLRWTASIVIDALLAFPALLVALLVRSIMEANWLSVSIAVGIAGIAPYAKVASAALDTATVLPHIEAARSIGATRWRIITRHIIPSALPTLSSFAGVLFAWSLLYGAAFAYLGLGGDIAAPDWGLMIARAQGYLVQAPLLVILPGAAIALGVWLAYRFSEAVTRF